MWYRGQCLTHTLTVAYLTGAKSFNCHPIKMRPMLTLLLITLFLIATIQPTYAQDNSDDDSADESENDGSDEPPRRRHKKEPPAVDKLAVNLAGAFIKSIFPEMNASPTSNSESSRRAPQHPNNIFENNPAIMGHPGSNGAIPLQHPHGSFPISPPGGGFLNGRTDLPAQYVYPFAAPGSVLQQTGGTGPAFALGAPTSSVDAPINIGTGIDQLNAGRNQNYLNQLQQHQGDLQTYSAKQSQYLDAQRKYQQQLLDQQTGAALLLQQQQLQYLQNQQRQYGAQNDNNAQGYLQDLQTGGHVLLDAKKQQPAFVQESPPDAEEYASDEYLKGFFKQNYGIDIPDDGQRKLSTEDRKALRALKQHLLKQQQQQGAESSSDDELQQPPLHAAATVHRTGKKQLTELPGEFVPNLPPMKKVTDSKSGGCNRTCIPIEFDRLAGAWTQIYGNRDQLKAIYTTLISLESLRGNINNATGIISTQLTSQHASCVGFQVGPAIGGGVAAPLKWYFRDDTKSHRLHEMTGWLKSDRSRSLLNIDLSMLKMDVCVIKIGATSPTKPIEYFIFTEQNDEDNCQAYHIFVRDALQFVKRHNSDVAQFMQQQVSKRLALPVAALPLPQLCQIGR